ncbi:MAG: VCBS repeat-containing protein, partial [Gammaproteobacteria bacterium]|nr:VCBS repeat-containing protein [Gammaproteobacteria bacterium]
FSASYADDEIAWYENDGSENFTAHVIDSSTTADGATSVHVADVDGDGDLDVLSSSLLSGDIVWYENDGSENFTTHNIALSNYPMDVTTADVDNDGDLDLLSVDYYSGDITWHENDGSENFTSHTIDTLSTASEIAGSVHVADVDDDGDLDVLATIYGDDKINWYENDGSENFTSHTITSSADGAYSVTTADVDGDGDLDVLSASELDDKIAWYENDGSENFTARTITTGADGARSVAAVDMDGDGNLDVVSASFNDDKIAWYKNTPTTTLDGTPSFTEGGSAVVLDADVEIRDAELDALNSGSGNYSGATVTLVRNGGANSDDVYSETGTLSALTQSGNLVVGGTTIGAVTTNSGGTLVLTFDSNATTALVNSALQQIAYSNSSDDPSASAQIDWSFDDGNTGGSQGTGGALQATGSTTVSITAVNDAPTAANNTVTTNEDTTYTFTAADFNYSDPESDTMASVKITTLETVGSLQLSGFDVTLNQVITKADIDAG